MYRTSMSAPHAVRGQQIDELVDRRVEWPM
jgi:hypothetical protein